MLFLINYDLYGRQWKSGLAKYAKMRMKHTELGALPQTRLEGYHAAHLPPHLPHSLLLSACLPVSCDTNRRTEQAHSAHGWTVDMTG